MNAYNLLDGWFKFDVGEGAFYSVFGFVFVFIGIALLIFILMAIGKIITVTQNKKKAKQDIEPIIPQAVAGKTETREGESVSPEVVAAITAALMAYYEAEQGKCDFIVRRIKKV